MAGVETGFCSVADPKACRAVLARNGVGLRGPVHGRVAEVSLACYPPIRQRVQVTAAFLEDKLTSTFGGELGRKEEAGIETSVERPSVWKGRGLRLCGGWERRSGGLRR